MALAAYSRSAHRIIAKAASLLLAPTGPFQPFVVGLGTQASRQRGGPGRRLRELNVAATAPAWEVFCRDICTTEAKRRHKEVRTKRRRRKCSQRAMHIATLQLR
eukprot:GHVT01100651.1.p2 GENE.GHVT01100651.1~~GHVT01100651.1.p2  ORF type:complete len:104 (-),score=14.19 GHVT01100651.1:255-566(-)